MSETRHIFDQLADQALAGLRLGHELVNLRFSAEFTWCDAEVVDAPLRG